MKAKIGLFCLCFLLAACIPVTPTTEQATQPAETLTVAPLPAPTATDAFSPTPTDLPVPSPSPQSGPTNPPRQPAVSLPTPPAASDEYLNAFADPTPEVWVDVMPALREYLYYRKLAVVSGQAETLWARYPDLRAGTDEPRGLNIEAGRIASYLGMGLFDGNVYPEYYHKINVADFGETVDVWMDGMELYTLIDETGQFNVSGGQLMIILSLRKDETGHWTVFRTHESDGTGKFR